MIVAVVLMGMFCPSASAKTIESTNVPYDTYMYDYSGNPIITPHAYIPSQVVSGSELGIGNFTNPLDIEVDDDNNIYVVDSEYDVYGVNSGAAVPAEADPSAEADTAEEAATKKRHLLNGHGKTTKLKRALRGTTYADKTNEAAIKRMILYK